MTDYMTANTISDLFRGLFALLDKVAYWLLGIMYEILFNVASADLFSNATIKNFYGRIQLIIGVFMIFKLAISIIQGIINPDTFTDKKAGFSNIITRIIFALVMLTVLTPINIPSAQTEYEIQLNNNGLLFGTLYSLQTRILENNTLGRLILGTTDSSLESTSDSTLTGADKQAAKLKQSANIFTSTILKGFVRINLKEADGDETKNEDRVCTNIDQDTLDVYTKLDANPNEILSLVNASCEAQGEGFFENILGKFKRLSGKDRYVFAYIPVISTIVAVIFIYILLGEIITIAIRSVKLAVLRILAPIPIISYIDPKQQKDGAFGAWTKALTSTYIELFLHLAVIYFIIFLIQDMIVNGIVINTSTGIVGIISFIFIMIGLFFFLRQAPKFIKDILGVKTSHSNIGLAGLLAGTARAVGGGGAVGFLSGMGEGVEMAHQTDMQGKPIGLGQIWKQNTDQMAKIRTGDKNARGGLLGRSLDYMDYRNRSRIADKYHINEYDQANADYEKSLAEARLRKSQYELEVAGRDLTSTAKTTDAYGNPIGDYKTALDRYNAAYATNEKAKSDVTLRTKAAEKMEKDRAELGLGTDVRSRRSPRYKSAKEVKTTKYTDAMGNTWKFADGTTDDVVAQDLTQDVPSTTADRAARDYGTDYKDFRK